MIACMRRWFLFGVVAYSSPAVMEVAATPNSIPFATR
jgi:hypothetical protein